VRIDSPQTNWHPVIDFTMIPTEIDGTGLRLSDHISQSLQKHKDALRKDPQIAPFVIYVFEKRQVRVESSCIDTEGPSYSQFS
jgi:hypothetical protein